MRKKKDGLFYGGYFPAIVDEKFDYADHAYVFCTTGKRIIKFSCYLPVYQQETMVAKGDVKLAEIISCGSPDDDRDTYYKIVCAKDSHLGARLNNGKEIPLGDCSGILYAITGVCFQMANRILYATQGYPRLCPYPHMKVLYLKFGIYGNSFRICGKRIFKNGVGSLNWLEYFAVCELLYEGEIEVPKDFNYDPYWDKIEKRARVIKRKMIRHAQKNDDKYLLFEIRRINNPFFLYVGRFRLLCRDAGIDFKDFKDNFRETLNDFINFLFEKKYNPTLKRHKMVIPVVSYSSPSLNRPRGSVKIHFEKRTMDIEEYIKEAEGKFDNLLKDIVNKKGDDYFQALFKESYSSSKKLFNQTISSLPNIDRSKSID